MKKLNSLWLWALLLVGAVFAFPGVSVANDTDTSGLAFAVAGTTLAETFLTLDDLAKQTDPSGALADIVEIVSERNEIIDDMLWTVR